MSTGPVAGRTLGRYELLIPIADGGMASVWAARMKGQRGFQKIVAIKQMRPELSDDPNFETMFLDEASLVSQLKHPNIAEILDLGEEEDALYQVMEYVDGEPLNQLVRQCKGGIPIPFAVRIVKEACSGLHAAHELRDDEGALVGLVHRDVSLQNILVTYDGVTKVIDFGVAKAMSNAQKTSVGQVKGKVPYMSPEQAVGEQVDRRTDVFALGIVLYQITTGKHPFRGETDLATIMRICEKTPVAPPSTLVKAIRPELDAVIVKALAKSRDERFATMSEMLRALEVVLPPDEQASAEDLGKFMQQLLGPRGEKRRQAIQEAGRTLDQAAGLVDRKSSMPPSRSTPLPVKIPRPAPLPSMLRVGDEGPGGDVTRREISVPPPISVAPGRPTPMAVTPWPTTPPDRTASDLPAGSAPGPTSPVARTPRFSGNLRTVVLGLLAAVVGLFGMLAALSLAAPGEIEPAAAILLPALSKASARVKPPMPSLAPTASPEPTGAGAGVTNATDAGTGDAGYAGDAAGTSDAATGKTKRERSSRPAKP